MNGNAAGRTEQASSAAGRDDTGTPPAGPAPNTGQTTGPKTARSVRWSLGAVLARQGFQMLCAVVLARILGPQSYGVIAAATVYISLVALVLDQGLSAALIQRPEVTRRMAGATATLNLLVAGVLAGITWFGAPWVSDFFGVDQLEPLLRLLAAAIPLKALAITPRAMLSRNLQLHRVGAADIAAAATGCAAGIGAALAGAGPWSMAYQVLTTDLVCSSLLLAAGRGPLPNFAFRQVVPLLRFSLSVFATDCLAYFSRNLDNILVGRVLGVSSLSLYGMAYRILVVPVQLIGQTVNRVMFPAFARSAGRREQVAASLVAATRILAISAIPLMTFVACAAPDLVFLVLGRDWLPAAALVSVLAIGGARETIFYITPSLMKGLGQGALIIRYEILAALVQVGGIVIGLQFGVFGVAVGYSAAGFVLTPVLLRIQTRLTGVSATSQLGSILPAVHAALWGAAGYGLWSLTDVDSVGHLLGGLVIFAALTLGALRLFHQRMLAGYAAQARALFGRTAVSRNGTGNRGQDPDTDRTGTKTTARTRTRPGTGKQKIAMAETKHSSGGAGADGLETGGIVIAVLTYRRPEDIALALPRLGAQAMSGGGAPDRQPATVLVIDNDPAASARPIVEQLAGTLAPDLVRYVHEPKPGIAAARNRALAEAAASALLVFIDDDEVPSERWLAQLVSLQRSTGAAAVVGPVVSEYEHEPEAWIEAGGFFRRRRLATGSRLDVAATNNLLLDLKQIRALQLRFDERFGLSGGSDTLFTRQLVQRGGTMLWCDEAVVVDRVPATRLTRGWVLRRALRSGNSAARVGLELAGNPAARLAARGASLASGSLRLLGGAARLAAGAATGSAAQRARGMRTAARGLGMASGAFGYVYSEYRRQ